MTDFVHDGRRTTLVIQNPTITERAAHIIGQYFRPVGRWTTNDQPRPRRLPDPVPDVSRGITERPPARTDYRQLQTELGRRHFMADHAHGGGGGGTSSTATNALVGAFAFLVVVLTVILFVNWATGHWPASRSATLYDDGDVQVRLVPRYTAPPPATRIITIPGQAGQPFSGIPTPQEAYSRAPHVSTRVCVACIDGYEQDPATCQCTRRTYHAGPMPTE